jgi:hypothetical protein
MYSTLIILLTNFQKCDKIILFAPPPPPATPPEKVYYPAFLSECKPSFLSGVYYDPNWKTTSYFQANGR